MYQILSNCANRDDSINVFIFQTSRKSIDDDKMIETPLRTCINKVHFTSTSKSFVLLLNIRLESCSITSRYNRSVPNSAEKFLFANFKKTFFQLKKDPGIESWRRRKESESTFDVRSVSVCIINCGSLDFFAFP